MKIDIANRQQRRLLVAFANTKDPGQDHLNVSSHTIPDRLSPSQCARKYSAADKQTEKRGISVAYWWYLQTVRTQVKTD